MSGRFLEVRKVKDLSMIYCRVFHRQLEKKIPELFEFPIKGRKQLGSSSAYEGKKRTEMGLSSVLST